MPNITIGDVTVNFPNTGRAPVWSEPVIQFAQAVEAALSGIVGSGDVSRQSFTLDASHNPASDVTLTGLSFSSSLVRAGFIRYSVFRTTTTDTAYEAGEMMVVFNPNGTSGSKWELQRNYVGDGLISFSIDDAGQFSFSTTAMAGANHSGLIQFVAQALLQS